MKSTNCSMLIMVVIVLLNTFGLVMHLPLVVVTLVELVQRLEIELIFSNNSSLMLMNTANSKLVLLINLLMVLAAVLALDHLL